MDLGEIPAASIERAMQSMDPDEAELFRHCIRLMDRAYLDGDEKVLTPEWFKSKGKGNVDG